MTAMCTSSYHDFNIYYDYDTFRVRYDRIKRNFDYMRKLGYSEQLVKVLSNCLEETEERRTTLTHLSEFLKTIDTADEDAIIHNMQQQRHIAQTSGINTMKEDLHLEGRAPNRISSNAQQIPHLSFGNSQANPVFFFV